MGKALGVMYLLGAPKAERTAPAPPAPSAPPAVPAPPAANKHRYSRSQCAVGTPGQRTDLKTVTEQMFHQQKKTE